MSSLGLLDIFRGMVKSPEVWTGKNGGEELEHSFSILLKKNRFTENRDATKDETDILKEIIEEAKQKNLETIENKHLDKFQDFTFITQPFGKNNFPDNIVFYKGKIIVVEIKYSDKSKKPMWNNSLPEAFALYVFGAKKEVTFFHGKGQLYAGLRSQMKEYMKIKQRMEDLQEKVKDLADIEKNPFGFCPYVRINYNNKKLTKSVEMNYFKKGVSKRNREEVEQYLMEIEDSCEVVCG